MSGDSGVAITDEVGSDDTSTLPDDTTTDDVMQSDDSTTDDGSTDDGSIGDDTTDDSDDDTTDDSDDDTTDDSDDATTDDSDDDTTDDSDDDMTDDPATDGADDDTTDDSDDDMTDDPATDGADDATTDDSDDDMTDDPATDDPATDDADDDMTDDPATDDADDDMTDDSTTDDSTTDDSTTDDSMSVPECDEGTHLCADACVNDSDPMHCGQACEPCTAPTGGTVDCDGTQCVPACPGDEQLCAGECLPSDAACEGECPGATQDCGGVCVDPNSTANCGASCEVCTAPQGGTATCNGVSCDFTCSGNYVKCDDQCWDTAAGECCENSDCDNGESCSSHECVDTVPPQVESISPALAANGVTALQPIVITFSEPMDQTSVQSALSITSLPSGARTLVWSNGGRVLTITPQGSGFPYASGTNIGSTAANTITVTVGTSARDLAGVTLGANFSSTFNTLRRITDVLPSITESEEFYNFGNGQRYHSLCPNTSSGNTGYIYVPLVSNAYPGGAGVEFFADGAQTSRTNIHTFESAVFRAVQADWTPTDFFDSNDLRLTRLQPTTGANGGLSDDEDWPEWPVLDDLGVLTSSPVANLSKDITAAFWSAWSAGQANQVYRVYPWPDGNGGNFQSGTTNLDCDEFEITLTYLVP